MYYDIIFIDGCHDYKNVCLDINNYSSMLKSGGYLNIGNKGIWFPNGFGIPIMEGTVINLRDSFNSTYGFTGYLIDK
jgi:hypothetical protein